VKDVEMKSISQQSIPTGAFNMSDLKIDPIIPILPGMLDQDETVSVLLQLNRDFGFRRFLLTAPWIGALLTGMPDREYYRQFGNFLLEVKNKLSNTDIQVGWWCMPTLETGKSPFQKITGIDGCVSEVDFIASCPLDEKFRDVFAQNIALVADIAKPFIIKMEDDYKIGGHGPVKFGCFCPLHLKEFAKRTGKEYSREELFKIFSSVTPESIQLRRQWGELSRDTLADFARSAREKIDEVSPETRISLCQSGMSGFDGDFTEAVASAFAGKTKPLVRVYGSAYSSDAAGDIPFALFNVLYSKQNLPEHFELIHESDPYPHTRFFMSAAKLKCLMGVAFSYGMNDSFILATQFLDDPLEESGYNAMVQAESKRFSTLRNEVRDCRPIGCEICHSPWSHITVPYDSWTAGRASLNPWIGVLGKLGIPYSVKPGKVKMLGGHYASFLSDDEVKDLLSKGVMMDGEAACILSQRGFGDLIGAEATPGQEAKFCFEKIEEDAGFEGIKGRLMYNFMFAIAGTEGKGFCKMVPHPQTKTLTSLIDPAGNAVMPGMIRFENSLGGRVVITAYKLQENLTSSSVFNYRKKEIVRQSIEWLGRETLPIYVKNLPNIFCIFNRSQTENKAIATLINLCSDSASEVELLVSDEWNGSRVDVLNDKGEWNPLKVTIANGSVIIPVELRLMEPVYLKFSC
jgi:hypothetical protein